jgi:uncharacterized protein
MSGRVVHFEIPFDDADRARGFYAEVFGWKVQPIPELEYTSVSTGPTTDEGYSKEPGYINGGMFRRSADPPRQPVVTIDVDSIDATLEQIEERGGKAVGSKLTVADMGFAAYFEDCEGNLIGLWETAGS